MRILLFLLSNDTWLSRFEQTFAYVCISIREIYFNESKGNTGF